MTNQASNLAIFKAGTHRAVDGRTLTFSPEVLRELAESYDPQLSEAPLVVGHPKLDAPAYGWTKSLRTDGSVLYAEPHQVEPQFAELVNAGRLKKVSASFYLPDSPGNPRPGKHYLRHIGFLGAAAPSVKGLPAVQFAADDDGAVEFAEIGYLGSTLVDLFQRLRDWLIERDGAEAAERVIPQWAIRSIDQATVAPPTAAESVSVAALAYAEPQPSNPESTMSEKTAEKAAEEAAAAAAEFAEREQAISTKESEIAAREQALQAREAEARREDAVEFADELVQAGKLLPREKDAVVELLLALPADTSVSFAEGESTVTKPAAELLQQLLRDRPTAIDFREKSATADAPAAVSFAAPDNLPVDAHSLERHARAVAYQSEHPNTPYVDAVKAVSG